MAMGATVAAELRAHRLAQVQALLSIGVRLTDDSFVVAQADGSPVQPNTLTHNWVIECAKIGLRRIRFHDMRHTHATHLLASGVHPKVASERLGRIRECASADCTWLFVDESRNHSRRWCEMRACGNRMKARRHYQRTTAKTKRPKGTV